MVAPVVAVVAVVTVVTVMAVVTVTTIGVATCVEESIARRKSCRGRAETDGTSLKSLFKKIAEYPAFSGTQTDQQQRQEHEQLTA